MSPELKRSHIPDIYTGEETDCIIDNPYPWQKALYELIKTIPDQRSILWIFNFKGNIGKTTFVKRLMYELLATLLDWGRSSDMKYVRMNTIDRKIICYDLPNT